MFTPKRCVWCMPHMMSNCSQGLRGHCALSAAALRFQQVTIPCQFLAAGMNVSAGGTSMLQVVHQGHGCLCVTRKGDLPSQADLVILIEAQHASVKHV
jgi:hypothetical protein